MRQDAPVSAPPGPARQPRPTTPAAAWRALEQGNARFARTLFEQSIGRQALRLTRDEGRAPDALDREDVATLTAEDIAAAARTLGGDPGPEQSRWRRWLG